MKSYNSVLSFGTTVHHQHKDGSDLTRKYVLDCVIDRINDIFASREQMEALWLEDTYEEDLSPVMQADCQSIYAAFRSAMVAAGHHEEIAYLNDAFRAFLEVKEKGVRQ
tara:strand:- start:40 stop:366 length:327 start_codon:yes stop_codon:yes gene_type:complete